MQIVNEQIQHEHLRAGIKQELDRRRKIAQAAQVLTPRRQRAALSPMLTASCCMTRIQSLASSYRPFDRPCMSMH